MPTEIARPRYDRAGLRVGVVHFGPGAFFRAHQMSVYERLLAHDPGWGVSAVALRGASARDALTPQDGLYTLTELGAGEPSRVMGGLREVLVAQDAPEAVLARLISADTRLVTATVTEKGYPSLREGRTDPDDTQLVADAGDAPWPSGLVGWVLAGLRERRTLGRRPFVTMSCDNLPSNGARLRDAVLTLARLRGESALAAWIEDQAPFPNTMVDSITPATDATLRTSVSERLGLADAAPVAREPFLQWVIEDHGRPEIAPLADVGAVFSADVSGFARAKLRLLNASHSALAYIGLLAGFETVAEAAADKRLGAFVERMARKDLAPFLQPSPELDIGAYLDAVLRRFRNPGVAHRLEQIAADGSAKLPVRLLPPTEEALAAGRRLDRLAWPVAAWMRFVVDRARVGGRLADPLAERLWAVGEQCVGDPQGDTERLLHGSGIFPASLTASPGYHEALASAYAQLGAADPLQHLPR